MMLRSKSHGGCDIPVCSGGSQWDDLLVDVVFSVLDKLLEALDHVRFAVVCKRWNSTAKDYNHITQRWRSMQVLPMLMIPSRSTVLSQELTLYSVFERTMYNNIKLPTVPAKERCCGLGHGWLASVDESLTNITLRRFPAASQNDQLNNVIHLPPLSRFCEKTALPKVVLTADPTLRPDSYIVLAFHGDKVAYIAGQQDCWNHCSIKVRGNFPKFVHAISYRSHVYLLDTWESSLLRFHISNSDDPNFKVVNTQLQISPKSCVYLVESTKGNLLVVEEVSALTEVPATTFKVSQVVPDDESTNSTFEVNSLGDEALFVCESHSMSVVASNLLGCQPNSIYYAYNSGSTWEMGIFNLENKMTTRLYSLNHCESNYMPFWITPSFKGLCL